MRDFTDKALIIKKIPFKENSYIVDLLTEKHGKISAIAQGARKNGGKLFGIIDYLNELNCELHHKNNKNLYILKSAELIVPYLYQANYELSKYYFAAAEILGQIIFNKDESEEIYKLTVQYLDYQKKVVHIAVFWRFLLKLFEIIGIKLYVTHCSVCKRQTEDLKVYSYYKKGFICAGCFKDNMKKSSITLSAKAKKVFFLLPQIGNYLNDLELDNSVSSEITNIFLTHLQLNFDKKFYLKSLKFNGLG